MQTEEKEKTGTVKIPPEMMQKIQPVLEFSGSNANNFGLSCIRAILALADSQPEERYLPQIIDLIDAANSRKPRPILRHKPEPLQLNEGLPPVNLKRTPDEEAAEHANRLLGKQKKPATK